MASDPDSFTAEFISASAKLHSVLKQTGVTPQYLKKLSLDILGLSAPAEIEGLKNRLLDMAVRAEVVYDQSVKQSHNVKVFAAKMRTQLLGILKQASDKCAKSPQEQMDLISAAIIVLQGMRDEAKTYSTGSECLRKAINELVKSTALVDGDMHSLIMETEADNENLKAEIERHKQRIAQLQNDADSKMQTSYWVWVFALPGIIAAAILRSQADGMNEQAIDLQKLVDKMNQKLTNSGTLLKYYQGIDGSVEKVKDYLQAEEYFWKNAILLLDDIERDANSKLEILTNTTYTVTAKTLAVISEMQMGLLNQALLALETGITTANATRPI